MSFGALILAAAQLTAAPGSSTFDVNCMVVSQIAHDDLDLSEAEKSNLLLSVMFFFGRADSALSPADIERELIVAERELTGQQMGPILQQCGAFMAERGETLTAVGRRLEKRGETKRID